MDNIILRKVSLPTVDFVLGKLGELFPTVEKEQWKTGRVSSSPRISILNLSCKDADVAAVSFIKEEELHIVNGKDLTSEQVLVFRLLDEDDNDRSDLTGDVIFINDSPANGELSFYLGPEIKSRGKKFVSAHNTMYDWLEKTLMPWANQHDYELEIGTSENLHTIANPREDTLNDLLDFLRSKLPEHITLNEHKLSKAKPSNAT